jgi:hypothetical protein
MQPSQPLPPPPNLGTGKAPQSAPSFSEQLAGKKDLKPTETKVAIPPITALTCSQVTTLADLGYTTTAESGKLGFREDEDPTEYFDMPEEFRKKVGTQLTEQLVLIL